LTVIGAGTSGSSEIDWNRVWLDSDERKAIEGRIDGSDGKPPLVSEQLHGRVPEGGKRAASRRQQLRYCIVRMYRRFWRLPAYNFTRLMTMLFLACLLGLALLQIASFSNDDNTQEAAGLIPGAAFLSILPGILSTNNAVSPAISTRAAMYRELAAGEYGVWAFYVAQGAAEVPYAVLTTVAFLVPYNALVGLPWSAFPFYLLAAVLFYTFAIFIGQAIAAVSPTEEIALTLAPLVNTILNVLSGFLIKRADIPSYWYVLCCSHGCLGSLLGACFDYRCVLVQSVLPGQLSDTALSFVSPCHALSVCLNPRIYRPLRHCRPLLPLQLARASPVPHCRIWLYWANPYAYFNAAVLRNLLSDMTFTCPPEERLIIPRPAEFSTCTAIPDGASYVDVTRPSGAPACAACPINSGSQVLERFTVMDVDKWIGIVALVGFIVLARVATALALKFTRHMTR